MRPAFHRPLTFASAVTLALTLVTAMWSGVAGAALVDRGNGLVYDTVLNITWTQAAGDGTVRTWEAATSWADSLVYGGFDDWRLPSMDRNGDGGVSACRGDYECSDNELGYMYYYNLGGAAAGSNKIGDQIGIDGVPITGIYYIYWSNTQSFTPILVYMFGFNGGIVNLGTKGYAEVGAWAVRDGDVTPVPEPGTFALMGTAMMGLALFMRRRRRITKGVAV